MKLNFWEIAEVVAAENDWKKWPDFELTGVEFDTRKIQEGNLFVPLKGVRDGHEFHQVAQENGAVASLWRTSVKEPRSNWPILVVEDPLKALQAIAQYYLKKRAPKVIGITGSNGKTTTKDMTAAVLGEKFVTYKTQGNYNNHIGLPYTILHMPDETEMLVLEMGMDHQGEIDFLSRLANPDVAAITMIGESHIEHLGSRKGIAKAKMEICAGLKPAGLLIVPEAEPLLTDLLQGIPQKIQTFGLTSKSDLVVELIDAGKNQTSFKTNQFQGTLFTIPVLGKYNMQNAAIALMIGDYFGVPVSAMQRGLAQLNLTQNRTEWLKAANGADLLSDVYNANPTAMSLVLDSFAKIPASGKKIAVLGDMLDLGPFSKSLHEGMSAHLSPSEIQEVYLYGPEMAALKDKLTETYQSEDLHFYEKNEKEELVNDLKKSVQPEDLVVLKGSNGMGLAEIVKKMMKNN